MPDYAQVSVTPMNNHNGIIKTLERKGDTSQAQPQRFVVVQRAAAELSRRNADAAVVEVFAEAMQRLTLLAYERDADGYCNIDAVTWRILIPLPFGKLGHRRWGITPSESVVLREMVQQRQLGRNGRAPGLFLFDASRRAWRLNLYDFDTLADGQKYWQRWPLSVQDYRAARSVRLGDRVGK